MQKKHKKFTNNPVLYHIIEGIKEKKGKEIVLADIHKLPNSVADYFIICHGTSKTQVAAIAESVQETVKKNTGVNAWHSEGFENAEWILIDYADVVVHVFQEYSRNFYKLEDLWADAVIQHFSDEEEIY